MAIDRRAARAKLFIIYKVHTGAVAYTKNTGVFSKIKKIGIFACFFAQT
jgi:hypothetical protein